MTATAAKKKRIRDPIKTRAKILQAAVDLIAEKGTEALSLKDTAIRAGVSRSVTYRHFKHRDHLLSDTKTWLFEQLEESVLHFDDTLPLYERVLHDTRLILNNQEVARAIVVEALGAGGMEKNHPLYKIVRKQLKKLRDDGAMDPDSDVDVLTCIHLGSIASTLLLATRYPKSDIERLSRRFAKEWTKILQAAPTRYPHAQ